MKKFHDWWMSLMFMAMLTVLVLGAAAVVQAEGWYQISMNGVQVDIVFLPGPFGPGEGGDAVLALNGVVVADPATGEAVRYDYWRMDDKTDPVPAPPQEE